MGPNAPGSQEPDRGAAKQILSGAARAANSEPATAVDSGGNVHGSSTGQLDATVASSPETTDKPSPPPGLQAFDAPLARAGFFNRPIQSDPFFWVALAYMTVVLIPASYVAGPLQGSFDTASQAQARLLDALFLGVVTPLALFAAVFVVLAAIRYLFRVATRRRRLRRHAPRPGAPAVWLPV